MLVLAAIAAWIALPRAAMAKSEEPWDIRGGLSVGASQAYFKETDGAGHEATQTTRPSLLLGLSFGFRFSIVFIEYNMTWVPAQDKLHIGPTRTRDASYFSSAGASAGVALPILPVEAYVGAEKAAYSMASGSEPSFEGYALKSGVILLLAHGEHRRFGVRGELKRFTALSDNAGKLPESVAATANLISLSLLFGF